MNEDDGKLGADLRVYANIYEPSTGKNLKQRQDDAEEIVLTWNDYPGEWTGSDYWCFWLPGNGHFDSNNIFRVTCDALVNNSSLLGREPTEIELLGQTKELYNAIFSNKEIIEFRKNMGLLNMIIGELK